MRRYRRKKYSEFVSETPDLNLAPIMNIVMILIPLLALMAVFVRAGVINISSPSTDTTTETTQPDPEARVPQVAISISNDGFRIFDRTNLSTFTGFIAPIERCRANEDQIRTSGNVETIRTNPPTVCLRDGADESARLVDQLDYASLYNHLVRIRMHPEWFEAMGTDEGGTLSVLADPDVPFDVLVRTMDTARHFMAAEPSLSAPSAGGDPAPYLLGDPVAPSVEAIDAAEHLNGPDGEPFDLFPNPVFLLPRPQG